MKLNNNNRQLSPPQLSPQLFLPPASCNTGANSEFLRHRETPPASADTEMHDLVLSCTQRPLPAACGDPEKEGELHPQKLPPAWGHPGNDILPVGCKGGCSCVDSGVPLLLLLLLGGLRGMQSRMGVPQP